ncbi:MAG: DNA primase [Bacteroidia bacterium]|jgi:DNA primase
MIRQSTIDQIFSAASVEEVVGDYVKLKRSGSGMGGLCPFHNEKSPSFKVSPNLGIYKCFGCGRGGNVIDFVMEIEKMTYPESLRHLASKYHIEIEEEQGNKEELSEQVKLREGLYAALEYAKNYFHANIHDDEEGKTVGYSYFKERGLTDQTIEGFGLGYGKNSWESFYTEAKAAGYAEDILVKAGLIKERNREDNKDVSYYDVYRERVMFPIHNVGGKVVGFGGRQLRNEKKSPKYINSPENDVYHKSSVLYGLFQAKKAIRTEEKVYLVEGYLDVLMLAQSGIENVVATSGTALTTDQVKLVKRFSENVTMLFDGDSAGIKAAMRGVDLLLEGGLNVRVVVFPEGEDPDSYCRKLGGTGLTQFIEENQKDFVHFKTEILLEEKGKDSVGLSETAREIVESIVKIPDPLKRNAFIKQTANLLQFDESLLMAEAKRIKHAATNAFNRQSQLKKQTSFLEPVPTLTPQITEDSKSKEQAILESLMLYSEQPYNEEVDVAGFIFSELEADGYAFEDPEFAECIDQAKEYYTFHNKLDESFFTKHRVLGKMAASVLSMKYELSPVWFETHEIYVVPDSENYVQVVIDNLNYLKLYKLGHIYTKEMEKLKIAESDEDAIIAQARVLKIIELRKSITDKLGIEGAIPE